LGSIKNLVVDLGVVLIFSWANETTKNNKDAKDVRNEKYKSVVKISFTPLSTKSCDG
jgi:hypothetical protein